MHFHHNMYPMPGAPSMMRTPEMAAAPGLMRENEMAARALMYPPVSPAGFVNLDVDVNPGMVTLDTSWPSVPPCTGVAVEEMVHHEMRHPASHPSPVPEVYVVKKGDTVYKIAKRFGTTMQAIILANNLRNPNLIYPGQVLYIPGA